MGTLKRFISAMVLSLIATGAITTPSLGQSDLSILNQLNKYKGEEKAIETKIGNERGDTAAKQKQINFWKKYARTELKAQAAPIQKRINSYNKEVRKAEAVRHAYNGKCAGKKLSRGGKARCDGEYNQLLSWKGRIAAKKRKLDKDKNKLRKRGADIHKKVTKLTSIVNRNKKRSRKLRADLKRVKQSIKRLEAKARRICGSKSTICEVIHHCASVRWDGTKPNLPLGKATRCKKR